MFRVVGLAHCRRISQVAARAVTQDVYTAARFGSSIRDNQQYKKATDYKKLLRGLETVERTATSQDTQNYPRPSVPAPEGAWFGDGATPPPGWVEQRSEEEMRRAWIAHKHLGVDVYPRTSDFKINWRDAHGESYWPLHDGDVDNGGEIDSGLTTSVPVRDVRNRYLKEEDFRYYAGEGAARSDIGQSVEPEEVRKLIRRRAEFDIEALTYQLFYDIEHGEEDVFEAIQFSRSHTKPQKRAMEREAERMLIEQEDLVDKAVEQGLPEPKFPPIRLRDLGAGQSTKFDWSHRGQFIMPENSFEEFDNYVEVQSQYTAEEGGPHLPGVDKLDLNYISPLSVTSVMPPVNFRHDIEWVHDNYTLDNQNPKVVLSVYVKNLGLGPEASAFLKELAGPRYNSKNDRLKLVARRYDTSVRNGIYVYRLLHRLVDESIKANPSSDSQYTASVEALFPEGPSVEKTPATLSPAAVQDMTDAFLDGSSENVEWNKPLTSEPLPEYVPLWEQLLREKAPEVLSVAVRRDPTLKLVGENVEPAPLIEDDYDYEYYSD